MKGTLTKTLYQQWDQFVILGEVSVTCVRKIYFLEINTNLKIFTIAVFV